jgi:surface antigen
MRQFTDEQLVAYVDGELTGPVAREIQAAAATDPRVSRRIEIFATSRRILADAFQAKKNESIPERLLAVFRVPVEGAAAGSRSAAPVRRRHYSRFALAMAAALVLAVGLALSILPRGTTRQTVALVDTPEILSAALETNPRGVPYQVEVGGIRHEVVPISTLRLREGTWCREFDSAAVQGAELHRTRGVACRSPDGQWLARAVATDVPAAQQPTGGYTVASAPAMSPALGPADVLTAEQEEAVIARRWVSN